MNGRRANWVFLFSIINSFLVAILAAFLFPSVADSLVGSNLITELAVVLPGLIFVAASREKLFSFLGFHKMKIGSVFMVGLFTFLSMPLITLMNVFSQIWVENETVAMMESYDVSNMPFWEMFLSLVIVAPLFEEVICRGIFYRSYRRSGSAFKAMLLSALLFALLHMNFNQAAYAVVMGIMAVLLVEATGSLWSSIIYHGLINGSSCITMYMSLKINPEVFSESAEVTPELLMYMIGIYIILTAVFLPMAFAVLAWIGKHEGREGALTAIWRERKWKPEMRVDKKGKMKKDKLITLPLILALILCVLAMTGVLLQFLSAVVLPWIIRNAGAM
ncbi:MAG: type II CAAX endopeptidase family protein [Bacillota bacterium]|nr:type II CAAX endopeptidase family protein [Bacillota bacterium]